MAVPGANRWLEAQIDSEPTRVIMMGLVAVMVALMAYVGYQLIDQLSRAHKKADAV
jgi:hypothetical protein